MEFLTQLRQRRVVQIIISYLVGGWIILQVVDQLVDRSVLPNLVYIIALIWYGLGLVAAMIIGWNHGEKGKQEAPRSEVIALILLTLFALSSSGIVVRQNLTQRAVRNASEHPLDQRNVAVMYFRDYTDDPQLSFIADGLTEDLIRALSSVNDLNVLTKNATLPYRTSDAPRDSIAGVLSVGTVVDGSVEKRGDQIQVTVQLIDGKSGRVIQRHKVQRPASELLAVRDSVVQQAADLLREWIGKEVRVRASQEGTQVREAWVLVQRAEKARKDAEAAVRKDGPTAGEAGFAGAEQLLQQAEALDGSWVEPLIQRAAISYRRARLSASGDPSKAAQLIDSGIAEAEHALQVSKDEPRALEVRGTLKYFKWLLNLTPDAAVRAQLLSDARADLQKAVGLDPTLASAHSTLSHMLYNEDLASAVIEAKQAYEADAYLEVAPDIVWRLFYGNFDLENFTQAKEWCQKGSQRFPADYRFAFCELRLMASPGATADVAHAWQLAARIDSLVPATQKQFEHLRSQIFVAGVLGRATLKDSAQAVLSRAHNQINPQIDPYYDLMWYEATVRLLLGQKEQSFDLMRRSILANPDQGLKQGEPLPWALRDLQDYPRVAELYTRK